MRLRQVFFSSGRYSLNTGLTVHQLKHNTILILNNSQMREGRRVGVGCSGFQVRTLTTLARSAFERF